MWSTAGRFGSYLRELREERRLTLDDIERITANAPEPVTRSLLSRLENGRARVSALKLMALARTYRVRLSVLAERLELLHAEADREPGREATAQLCSEAHSALAAENVDRARTLFDRIEQSSDAEPRVVQTLRLEIARRLLEQSRPRAARELLEPSLSMTPDDPCALPLLLLLAQVARALGQPLLVRSATLALRLHPRPWPKSLLCDAAALDSFEHTQAGRTDQATETWLAAVDVASREGDHLNAARAALELARLERSRRHPQTALTWLDNARSQAEFASDAALLAVISLELGHVQSARQRWSLARRAWSEARQRAREIDRHDIAFDALLQLWRLARAQADAADERAALRALRLLSRSIEEIPRDASDLLPHLRRTQPASERNNVNG